MRPLTSSRPVWASCHRHGGQAGLGLALTFCCACGGGAASQPRVEPAQREVMSSEGGEADSERMDEIQRLCNRKAGTAVPSCWNDEYMRTRKKFEAQITLMLQINPGGRADEVRVVSTSTQSKELLDCLVREAKGWSYPEGKTPLFVNCSFFLRSSM